MSIQIQYQVNKATTWAIFGITAENCEKKKAILLGRLLQPFLYEFLSKYESLEVVIPLIASRVRLPALSAAGGGGRSRSRSPHYQQIARRCVCSGRSFSSTCRPIPTFWMCVEPRSGLRLYCFNTVLTMVPPHARIATLSFIESLRYRQTGN